MARIGGESSTDFAMPLRVQTETENNLTRAQQAEALWADSARQLRERICSKNRGTSIGRNVNRASIVSLAGVSKEEALVFSRPSRAPHEQTAVRPSRNTRCASTRILKTPRDFSRLDSPTFATGRRCCPVAVVLNKSRRRSYASFQGFLMDLAKEELPRHNGTGLSE
ncbi:hypothetical protein IQ06DRAFT_83031 [Phaeosphaeriaceae sp. SRC1lsM3a]|nr:hypothetical protein IQ06DRAFT_83031 [Stagonospora sp. SRC1lsM3a]